MGITKRDLLDIEVAYERVGEVYNHIGYPKEHECLTCGTPSSSEFCSAECHEARFY